MKHGSRTTYVTHKCRCEPCRQANADYARRSCAQWQSRTPEARRAQKDRALARRPRAPRPTPVERLCAGITVDPETGCWIPRQKPGPRGYVYISLDGQCCAQAHRLMYAAHNGPIPDGLYLDHLCRNPRCCNPEHLEAVTHAENVRRGLAVVARSSRAEFERDHRDRLIAANALITGIGEGGYV